MTANQVQEIPNIRCTDVFHRGKLFFGYDRKNINKNLYNQSKLYWEYSSGLFSTEYKSLV